MTRRERLEAKLAKRREWAGSRKPRASRDYAKAALSEEATGIPLGQPILVGHHSEARHRRVIERADNAMRRAVESSDMAAHHASKADGIERALDSSIFSDDADATEALRERIADREAEAARIVAYNKSARKAAKAGEKTGDLSILDEAQRADLLNTFKVCPYHIKPGCPMPGYVLTNLRGRINADKKRLASVALQQETASKAEASETGYVIEGGDWVSVTFAEKPGRDILTALKQAGFRWGRGSWTGKRVDLPDCIPCQA